MLNKKKLTLGQEVQDLLTAYQNFALIKIDKTSHHSLESLRKELKKNQAGFKVVKNTLFEKTVNKLAKKNKAYTELIKTFFPLKETSAILLLEKEWNNGLSAFYQFIKKETSLSFKFGQLDEKTYGNEDLLRIAQLPPRNQLLANLIGSFKTPSARLVYSLKFNLTRLVDILKAKANKTN